jgi:hypothetical protein
MIEESKNRGAFQATLPVTVTTGTASINSASASNDGSSRTTLIVGGATMSLATGTFVALSRTHNASTALASDDFFDEMGST